MWWYGNQRVSDRSAPIARRGARRDHPARCNLLHVPDADPLLPVPGSIEESWNVGVGLVFFPGAGFLDPSNYYRPLFDVANNGTLFYDVD